MSKLCAIPGCRSQLRSSVMFGVADNSSLAQWWTTTPWYDEVKEASISRDLKICVLHFRKDELDNTYHPEVRLKSNVVPSENLPNLMAISAVQGNYGEPATQQQEQNLLAIYCRFCAKKQKHPIENHLEDLVESEDLLQLCLGRGRFLEGFPNGVCDHCLQILKVTTSFIKNCGQAQDKLQKLFFGTSQQMADSLVEDGEEDVDEQDSFDMPEAIISLKEEMIEDSSDDDNLDEIEFLEVSSQDPLDEEREEQRRVGGTTVSRVPPPVIRVAAPRRNYNKPPENQGDIRCFECDRTFNRKRALKAHMESIHEGRTFSCPICGKSMGWRKTLQRHMKSHEENFQKHKCDLCDKAFSRPSHLRLHMTKHTGQKVRCPMCKNGYRDTYKLGEHLMKAHLMDPDTAKVHAQQAEFW